MKKLLSMVWAMMLLFASMGVLAAGETPEVVTNGNSTVVWSWDFESAEGEKVGNIPVVMYGSAAGSGSSLFDGSTTVVDKDTDPNKLRPYSGEQYLYVNGGTQGSNRYGYHFVFRDNRLPELETGTLYRFSFRYATTYSVPMPSLIVNVGGNQIALEKAWKSFPWPGSTATSTSENVVWQYHEFYFVSPNDFGDQSNKLGVIILPYVKAVDYYDDFKLEKINGKTAISFKSDLGATTTASSLLTLSNIGSAVKPQTGYKVGDGNPYIYAFGNNAEPVTELNKDTKTVYVSATHMPEQLNETIYMVVGKYQKVNGKPMLCDFVVEPLTYEAKKVMNAEDPSKVDYYSYDETNLYKNNVVKLDFDAPENYYLKAFTISNLTGLESLTTAATLPNAQ